MGHKVCEGSRGHDHVTADRRIRDLADAPLVRDTHNEAVLAVIEPIPVLRNHLAAGLEVGLQHSDLIGGLLDRALLVQ